jgi:hypothetical protein
VWHSPSTLKAVIMTNDKSHWDRSFATRAADKVSWFQQEPVTSLRFIDAAGVHPAT